MQYKQIVFDVDGTLIDTEYAVLHSLQDTVEYMTGTKPKIEKLIFALGITGEDALLQLGMTDIPFVLSLWDKNMEKYASRVQVFDNINNLLEQLTSCGYELGIVISKIKKEFMCDFSVFGIDNYFKTIVCADDTNEHKPNPAPILKYMELVQCDKKELLYIGDSVYDMECAMRAGIDFALAGWGQKENLNTPISYLTPLDAIQHLCI